MRLVSVEPGPSLCISGADMVDGTPIYDIKPYIPYADSIPDAAAGFTTLSWEPLQVCFRVPVPEQAPAGWDIALREVLAQDPRPAYQQDPERLYHIILRPYEVTFRVVDNMAHVTGICPAT